MRIEELDREGLPKSVIHVWQQQVGDYLLPVQRKAIAAGLLSRPNTTRSGNENLLVCAPTSSGKSFCAEMAALSTLAERRRVIWLTPLKSLARQIHETLAERFASLKLRSLPVSGDYPGNDRPFLAGDYDVAIVIYEKAEALCTARPDCMVGVGLVIADEIQTVFEPERGLAVDRLLTLIITGHSAARLLCLSATLDGNRADRLAKWLKADLVRESSRPVDLLCGVAVDGTCRFRSTNTGEDSTEPFPEADVGMDASEGLLRMLAEQEGTTLVFLKSRHDTVALAFRLASEVNWPPAKIALRDLADEEPSFLMRSLTQALKKGVAFHSADLTPKQRRIIEQAVNKKQVRVVFATTTLALGVNLPAESVFIETVRFDTDLTASRPALVPISREEFDNMAGRAGRLGHGDQKPGRAIILADSSFDRDVLWDAYVRSGRSESPSEIEGCHDVAELALIGIASGQVSSLGQLPAFLNATIRARANGPISTIAVREAIEHLQQNGFIGAVEEGEVLEVTPVGKAVACHGLPHGDARRYLDLMQRSIPETLIGWLALAASGRHWRFPSGLLHGSELAEQRPLRQLYERFDHALSDVGGLLPDDHKRRPLAYRQAGSLKAVLVLDDWARLAPAQRMEERYHLHPGQVMSLAETFAHLLGSLAALGEATDFMSNSFRQVRRLAFTVRHGLPVGFEGLHSRLGDILSRGDFAALRKCGVETFQELVELSAQGLEDVPLNDRKIQAINTIAAQVKEEVEMKGEFTNSVQISGGIPQLIEIDGTPDRERYLVRINGRPVRLTGKSFKYFTKLAWSRRNRESGWIYKEDIEAGLNQARYLYRMKHEVNAELAFSWPVVENNRLGYYRLDVDPDNIRFNRQNLLDHPDWEVRSIFGSSEPSVSAEFGRQAS